MSDAHVTAEGLYKVFGDDPTGGVRRLKAGLTKDKLLSEAGMSVAVRDASFSVERGELFVLMGLSGSGKSTLLRMVNRLVDPSAGRLLVDGRDVMRLDDRELIALRRRQTAMVFQTFALVPHLNVFKNVAFGLEVRGIARRERRRRVQRALTLVGLEGHEDSLPRALSGGMQQRVGLARALCVEPELLLMDEAFSALDPLIRDEMQSQLAKLQRESPRTILFVSHDLDEAIRLGDRIAIMEGGAIRQIGTPEEIVRTPADDFVRSFVSGVDTTKMLRAVDLVEPADGQPPSDHRPLDAEASLAEVTRRVLAAEDPVWVVDASGTRGRVSRDTLIRKVVCP